MQVYSGSERRTFTTLRWSDWLLPPVLHGAFSTCGFEPSTAAIAIIQQQSFLCEEKNIYDIAHQGIIKSSFDEHYSIQHLHSSFPNAESRQLLRYLLSHFALPHSIEAEVIMSNRPVFVATHPRACSTAFERVSFWAFRRIRRTTC